jgi:hypothetical protein
LFRHDSDELVALLSSPDLEAANAVAERIQRNILDHGLTGHGIPSAFTVNTHVTCVSTPRDGRSFQELLTAAQSRIVPQREPRTHIH